MDYSSLTVSEIIAVTQLIRLSRNSDDDDEMKKIINGVVEKGEYSGELKGLLEDVLPRRKPKFRSIADVYGETEALIGGGYKKRRGRNRRCQ